MTTLVHANGLAAAPAAHNPPTGSTPSIAPNASTPSTTCRSSPRALLRELLLRERRLALYGFMLLALLVPMAVAYGLDDRLLRGANIWVKPMKFALSIAVLAFTTAWFIGHLPRAARANRTVRWIVGLVIAMGSFELGYITLQAALGQASHYNVGSTFHAVMYPLMGIGALLLTATQPMLAWQLHRHAGTSRPAPYRLAVKLGLVLTFVFGAGVGMLLSGLQPPSAGHVPTLPLLGWALQGGDLRPAHFVGIHAEQVLPLAGLLFSQRGAAKGTRAVWASALAYAGLFAAALAWGLAGRF